MSSGKSDQPQPQNCVRLMKRSNSNRRTGVQREKDLSQTSTAGRGPRTRDQGQPRRIGPCCLRRASSNPQRQHSFVGDRQESESSLRSDPGNKDRAPRFLWCETLVESQTVQPLLPHQRPDVKAFGPSTPRSFTKLHGSSLDAGAATRRAISTKLRRSVSAEAPAFSAPSACRRALSSAS